MIVFICSIFMLFEWFATATKKPTVTDLSHRWPWAILVWAWMFLLTGHFIFAAREKTRGD